MPQQALALANSELVAAPQARGSGPRARGGASARPDGVRPRPPSSSILARPPTREEMRAWRRVSSTERRGALDARSRRCAAGGADGDRRSPRPTPRSRARENLVHVLLNHNDFVTITVRCRPWMPEDIQIPRGGRCRGITRRSFLADTGMGFTGLALGAMLFRDGVARADAGRTAPPDGEPHFAAEAKTRHLDLPLRRRQPRRELRPQAGAEQVRRQVDRRDAVQGRARPEAAQREPGRRQPGARRPQDAHAAADRLPEVRPVRPGGRRLVAAHRRVRRRPRRRPLAVDDPQRPRRAAHVAHRPAPARGRVPDDRLVGQLRPRAR